MQYDASKTPASQKINHKFDLALPTSNNLQCLPTDTPALIH